MGLEGANFVAASRQPEGQPGVLVVATDAGSSIVGLRWTGEMAELATEWTIPIDGPMGLIAEDVDGDGLEDILSVGFRERSLVVRWNGAGAASRLPVSCAPVGLAVGRLLGPEKAVVVACDRQTAILVRGLNDRQLREEPIPGSGSSVAIGQLDGLFGDDIALIDQRDGGVVIDFLAGNEAGTGWELKTLPLAIGFRPFSVASGDLDGDGIDELVVGGGNVETGAVAAAKLTASGASVSANIAIPNQALKIHVVDLPGTPGRELLVASNLSANVAVVSSVLSSQPEVRGYHLGDGVRDAAAVLGPDGRQHLVGVDGISGQIAISGPTDDPIPTRIVVPVGRAPSISTRVSNESLLVTDVRGTAAALVDLRMSHFGKTQYVTTDLGPSDGAAINCLGDDRPELLVAHKYAESLKVFRTLDDGSLGLAATYAVGALFRMDGADLDGDGEPEIVGLSADDGSIQVFSLGEECRPTLVQEVLAGVLSSDFVVADFDGDGDGDILVSDLSESKITVLSNKQGSLEAEAITTLAPAWSLAVGDVDADGVRDLVVAHPDSKALEVLIGGSSGRPRARVVRVTRNAAELVAVVDIDGDGEDEILALNRAGGIELFDGSSSGFAELGNLNQPGEYSWVALQDLDRDGTPDLVVSDVSSKGVAFERIQCEP